MAIRPFEAHLNFKKHRKKNWFSEPSKPYQVKPQTFTSQFSNLKPYKVQKSQISNLKSSILNSQTSNLKISNPKSLGVGGMSRRR